MELKGGVRRKPRAWLRDTGSLKVGSPQLSLFTGLPPNPPPSPAASVFLVSSLSPPGPSYDTPSHRCSSMDAVFSPAHPPPPTCPLSQDLTAQGQSRHLHLAAGKMASTSMTILKLCLGGGVKSFYEKLCIVFSRDWTPPHLLKTLQ